MNEFDYKKLYPFKWFVLQNFPFIEEDFDAITNYQLYCKVVEYLNKTLENVNVIGTKLEQLVNAFNDLQDYVNNYFENLDIQEEINNKLDEMAESGQLTELLTSYLELMCIYGYNTITDMENAENLIDGSFMRTYGKNETYDGLGAFYKARQIRNTDVIDGDNIVALANENLVAEKIKDINLSKVKEKVDNPLCEILDTEIFGQINPQTVDVSNNGCQTFAIGNNVVVSCWSHNTDSDKSILVSHNITTGNQIDYADNLTLGHCNDVTYCDKDGYFYIACGGGSNGLPKIVVINENLDIVREIDFSNSATGYPYAIAYNNEIDKFYLLCGTNQIYQMNYDLDTVEKVNNLVSQNRTTVQQGIFTDGKYIFNIKNLTNKFGTYANYNKLDVYDLDLNYYTSQYMPIFSEIEAGCYYNNELYLMKYTERKGIIYKAKSKQNSNIYDYINNNLFFSNIFPIYGTPNVIYVDSTYTNLLSDGSEEKPFSSLTIALTNLYNCGSKVQVYLKGDFTGTNILVQKFDGELSFIGSGSQIKIGGVGVHNCTKLILNNLELTQRNDFDNNLLSTRDCKGVNLTDVKFNGAGTEQRAINSENSNYIIGNVNFASSVTTNIMAFYNGSYCRFTGSITIADTSHPPYFSTQDNGLWYRPPISMLACDEAWRTTILGGGITFNLKDITKNGNYRVEGGNTVSDAPSSLQTNGIKFSVNNIGTGIIYTVTDYNCSVLYVGVKPLNSSTIKWSQLIS